MKIINKLLVALLVLSFFACNKKDEAQVSNPTPDSNKQITYRLSMGGQFKEETPLNARVASDSTTVYGVQVYQYNQSGGRNNYAWGIYENPDNIEISLFEGKEYKFEVTAIRQGTGHGLYFSEYSSYYYAPFYQNYYGDSMYYSLDDNISPYYSYARVWTNEEKNSTDYLGRPELDRYYGYVDHFSATETSPEITIDLARVSFGRSFKVNNLQEGKLIIKMQYTEDIELSANAGAQVVSPQEIISFSNLTSPFESWKMAGNNAAYQENISTQMIREDADGRQEVVFQSSLSFRQFTATTYTITLDSVGGTNPEGGVSIVLHETPLSEEEKEVPVGSNDDTESPSTPNIVFSNVTSTSFTASWDGVTDNVGVSRYELIISGDGESSEAYFNADVTSLDFSDLTPNTEYFVRVYAYDEAGNSSTSYSYQMTLE